MLAGAFAAVAAAHVTEAPSPPRRRGRRGPAVARPRLRSGVQRRKRHRAGGGDQHPAVGLTSFLLPQLFGVRGSFQPEGGVRILRIAIPGLSDLPFIGPVLFNLSILGYAALLLVPATWLFLFRTQWGLRLRGVGERPLAAETLGVSSTVYRYAAVVASGVLAGLAGAQLALGNVGVFTEGHPTAPGWNAVVAVMLGRAHPFGVLAACLLFGFTEAFGFRLQGQGYPVQITDALPFVVTLVALVIAGSGSAGSSTSPPRRSERQVRDRADRQSQSRSAGIEATIAANAALILGWFSFRRRHTAAAVTGGSEPSEVPASASVTNDRFTQHISASRMRVTSGCWVIERTSHPIAWNHLIRRGGEPRAGEHDRRAPGWNLSPSCRATSPRRARPGSRARPSTRAPRRGRRRRSPEGGGGRRTGHRARSRRFGSRRGGSPPPRR